MGVHCPELKKAGFAAIPFLDSAFALGACIMLRGLESCASWR